MKGGREGVVSHGNWQQFLYSYTTYPQEYMHIHTHMHTCTHTHIHTHTHPHTHIHTHMHTHTFAHTHAHTHTQRERGRSEVHYCSAARWLPLSLPGPSPVGGCDSCNAGCSTGSSHHGMESRTGCGSVSIWEKERGRERCSTLVMLEKVTEEQTHIHGMA